MLHNNSVTNCAKNSLSLCLDCRHNNNNNMYLYLLKLLVITSLNFMIHGLGIKPKNKDK